LVPAPTTTVDLTKKAGQEMLADYAPVAAADNTLQAKIPNATTVDQIAADVAPLVPIGNRYEHELTKINWPASAISDAHAYTESIAAEIGVLNTASAQTNLSISSWESQLSSASGTELAAANALRHDLGLPLEQA
jgi:hypothetical protein